jgi:hypothetical protein
MINNHIEKKFSPAQKKEYIILFLAFITGGMLRFLSSTDNLWFDEIWSVNFVRSMQSSWDVLTINHDNNHILNTLYLYYFGYGDVWPRYRFLSIVTGTLSIPIMGYIGFKRGFATGIITTLLVVFSYPLIIYSSEARGYAPAIFFSLTAYLAFQNYNKQSNFISLSVFWTSCILGILSHLTFIYIFAGLFLSSVLPAKKEFNKIIFYKRLTAWYFLPALFMTFLYLFFVKGMMIGGGESIGTITGRLADFLSPLTGLMPGSTAGIIAATLIFITVSAWILTAERKFSADWIFYALILVIVPSIAFILPFDFFSSRYLALLLPFLYLMIASMMTKLSSLSKTGMVICIAFCSLLIAGSIVRLHDQLTIGRGHYLEAVRYIMNNSPSSQVSIITDHELRNSTVINFYKQFIPLSKEIDYISVNDMISKRKEAPEWLITHHRFDPEFTPPLYGGPKDHKYKLVKISPSANMLSGWNWYIYKKQ